MEKINLEQFEALLCMDGWVHDQEIEVTHTETHEDCVSNPYTGEIEITSSEIVFGNAWVSSVRDKVTVTYSETWSYVKHDEDSFVHGEENGDGVDGLITVEGIIVVDGYDDKATSRELLDIEIPSNFSSIDYSELEIEEPEYIGMDKGDLGGQVLHVDNAPNIHFIGKCIATAASSDNNASGSSYSGQTGRWTELALYKTEYGRYICYKEECTRWQGEGCRSTALVCNSINDAIDFFGYTWLAKDLYENGQIDAVNNIDANEADMTNDTITLSVDNKPDIRFTGECIGAASSSDNNASGSSYSGSTGRWTELKLYKTIGGRYICHQVGRTRWQGERDLYKAKVCETEEDVISFFGHRWLAKELYANAGIEDVSVID